MMKGNKYQDIFLSRIDEIEKCLENELYLAALALALTLPDICGCAEYPNKSAVKRHKAKGKRHKGRNKRHKLKGIHYKGICKCKRCKVISKRYKGMGQRYRGICKCYMVKGKRKRYNNVGERYKNWYDRYVGINQRLNNPYGADMPYLSGEVVYSLRNLFLHVGNPNIDKDKIKAGLCKIDHFSLLIDDEVLSDMSSVSYGDNLHITKRGYEANIKLLCLRLCKAAKQYYEDNREKFTFFQYDIHEID